MKPTLLGVLLLVCLRAGVVQAADYHLDAASGDDSRDGRTPSTAWRTLERANSAVLQPGDQLLLRAHQTFHGTLRLGPDDAGTPEQPVVVRSFGEGRATIEAGLGYAVLVENAGGVEVRDLVCVGSDRTRNQGAGVAFVNTLPGNRKLRHVRIRSVEARGFGRELPQPKTLPEGYQLPRGAGILVAGNASDHSKSGFADVEITGCAAHDNAYYGILITGAWDAKATHYANSDVRILDCRVFENPGDPLYHENHSGSGMLVEDCDGGLVDHCVAFENGALCNDAPGGPCGIWTAVARRVVIQNCESFRNRTRTGDGDGFDLDGGCIECVLQYNYSHDNEGAGFLVYTYADAPHEDRGNVVRWNVSENDARRNRQYGGICLGNSGDGMSGVQVYHNTVIMSRTNDLADCVMAVEAPGIGVALWNNVFLGAGGVPLVRLAEKHDTVSFQGNVYGGSHSDLARIGHRVVKNLDAWRSLGMERFGNCTTGRWIEPALDLTAPRGPAGDLSRLSSLNAFRPPPSRVEDFKGLDLKTAFGVDLGARDWSGSPLPTATSPNAGALTALLISFSAATPNLVSISLDFTRHVFQLDGTDGASVCQFHSAKPDGSAAAANVAYSTLGGFPDDARTTEFGKFCDAAFSTNGMALSQLWVTPCPLQTPRESVGDHYTAEAWLRLDFGMYEPNVLPTNRFYNSQGSDLGLVRGHTVAMLQASLRRARVEGLRVSYWTDVHTDFPPWMWKDGLRRNPVRDEMFEEAALHTVYFVKWLTSKHGIPIHAVSFVNEPDMPNRHAFTPDQLLHAAKLLRERLDEAGLTGVRVMPCTAISLGPARLGWANKDVDTLNQLVSLLEGSMKDHAPFVDILAGHGSQSETPIGHLPENTRFWRASGDFNEHWTNSVGFDMGPPSMLDEVIRHNTWLYGRGLAQVGIWQIASRMGIGGDFFRMPEKFDLLTFGRREAIDGASTVDPFLRPGMFTVAGSQARSAREPYSVDGFGGRGHREVVVISNDGQPRTFEVRMDGVRAAAVDVLQATVQAGRKRLDPQPLRGGKVNLTVPADSVTTLVAQAPSTKPRVYLVIKDTDALTPNDRKWHAALAAYDTVLLSQSLCAADQDALQTKRHPVDAFGAAAFVISDSVDRLETVAAHHVVMAPVIAIGGHATRMVGLEPGARRAGGEALSFRSELDPPVEMLDSGLPRACGKRASLPTDASTGELADLLTWALMPNI